MQRQRLFRTCTIPFPSRWRLIIMFVASLFIRRGASQANTSLALVWSTTVADDGRGSIFFLYGDPKSYRNQMQLNQTLDGSTVYITRTNVQSSRFIALDASYTRQQLFHSGSDGSVNYGSVIATPGTPYNYYILNIPAVSNSVTGLSIDWVSNLTYWSDANYQRIGVIEIRRYLLWRPIVESGLTSPQDVAVYPQQGFLFWSDSSPKIERLNLATNVRQVIVSNSSLQRPTTLVIDYVTQRLLWLDSASSRIGSVNLDGSGLSFWTLQLFSSISSFVIFKDYIFLGDKTQSRSYAYNYSEKAFVGCVTAAGRAGIIDMTASAPEKQPQFTSPCNLRNGGCNHFCITKSSTESVCQCSMGFFLDSDGITCNPELLEDNFLLVSDQNQHNIFQVDLGTGEVRAASVTPLDLFKITAMDYDPASNTVYGFDSDKYSIRKVTLADHSTSTVLQFQDTTIISSLAVDTVGRLLYYVNYDLGTINMASLSGDSSRPVVSGDGTLATAIALDVQNRLMFWSDCSAGRRSIEKAQMSNPSTHSSVVTISGLCATAVATDFPNEVIYWADNTGRLEQISYSGVGRLLLRQLPSTSSIRGLAVDAKFVYISGSNMRQIQRISRNTNELSNLTGNRFTNLYSLVLFNSSAGTLMPSTSSTSDAPVFGSTVSVTATTENGSSASNDKTIILAAVICGSVVLIAVIVTLGIICGRRCKKKPQRAEGTRPTVTSGEPQQTDNGGYASLVDSGRCTWQPPSSRNVNTVSESVGNVYGHALASYGANHSQFQTPSYQDDKYMSIINPPTYAELVGVDHGPPETPPRPR